MSRLDELLLRKEGFERLLDDAPQGVVVRTEQEHDAGRLAVEGRGNGEQQTVDHLLDVRFGNGNIAIQVVAGAPRGHRIQE